MTSSAAGPLWVGGSAKVTAALHAIGADAVESSELTKDVARGRHVVIAPSASKGDPAAAAKRDAKRAQGFGATAVSLMLAPPYGADVADYVECANGSASLSKLAACAEPLAGSSAATGSGAGSGVRVWPSEPLDVFRDIIAPAYSTDHVPPCVATFAESFSASTGFDRSAAMVAAIAAAAAVTDDRYRLCVRPHADWWESARLWVVVLGGPSAGKSPTIRAATDPIKQLHREQWAQWHATNGNRKPEEREAEPCLFTSDTTLEAFSDVLRVNPRGVLMLTEEFASWIGSIDAYRNGQGSRDRGEMLQLYDGGPHQVNRVKRGSFLVPNWGASVIAAGTPAGLQQQIKQLPDDGLIHRFIPCIMRRPAPCEATSTKAASEMWERTLRNLFAWTTTEKPSQRARFTPEASAAFEAEAHRIREATADAESIAPALASHLGKHPGMVARVALTFHLLMQERSDGIPLSTVEMAIGFMRTARRHAAALFLDILLTSPVRDLARAVARSIAAATELPDELSRAWLSSHCRPFRDAPDHHRRAAVEFLEDASWMRAMPGSRPYGGWSATSWELHPSVVSRFSSEGEEHRRRRANVRALFAGEEG